MTHIRFADMSSRAYMISAYSDDVAITAMRNSAWIISRSLHLERIDITILVSPVRLRGQVRFVSEPVIVQRFIYAGEFKRAGALQDRSVRCTSVDARKVSVRLMQVAYPIICLLAISTGVLLGFLASCVLMPDPRNQSYCQQRCTVLNEEGGATSYQPRAEPDSTESCRLMLLPDSQAGKLSRSGGSGGNAQNLEKTGNVYTHGEGRDTQFLGDFLVGFSCRHQTQNLLLASRERAQGVNRRFIEYRAFRLVLDDNFALADSDNGLGYLLRVDVLADKTISPVRHDLSNGLGVIDHGHDDNGGTPELVAQFGDGLHRIQTWKAQVENQRVNFIARARKHQHLIEVAGLLDNCLW
ncbi:Unknown protein sequence [Pseudomonas syringae pv. tomato]|nr:Unknown protein sequence [Pseudomonas syringae pv. tomato]